MSDLVDAVWRARGLIAADEYRYVGRVNCGTDLLIGLVAHIDALTARVAQLEACLTDTVQQLGLGGVTE